VLTCTDCGRVADTGSQDDWGADHDEPGWLCIECVELRLRTMGLPEGLL
jgi:hypothetical protein